MAKMMMMTTMTMMMRRKTKKITNVPVSVVTRNVHVVSS